MFFMFFICKLMFLSPMICRDTDVLLLLVHFMSTKAAEVWMISGNKEVEMLCLRDWPSCGG